MEVARNPQEPDERSLDDTFSLANPLRPADRAELFRQLSPAEQADLAQRLDPAALAPVLEALLPRGEDALQPFRAIPPERLAAILDLCPRSVAAQILRVHPEEHAQLILQTMGDPQALSALLEHRAGTAGSIMTAEMVIFPGDMTVEEAVSRLRQAHVLFLENVDEVYVVDREGRLVGSVSYRDLLLAMPYARLATVMDPEVISVSPTTPDEESARLIGRYDLPSLPVVDGQGRPLGYVAVDNVLPVVQKRATADMYRLALLASPEGVQTPLWTSVRRRLPWLILNLATAILAGVVVALFESVIARAAILAALIPIVGGQAGVTGIQTATIIVRSIALGEVSLRTARRALIKEALASAFNGLATGVVAGSLALLWTRDVSLSLLLGGALFGSMIVASVAGVLVPVVLKALRLDPALASPIFVTTVTDVAGILLVLGIPALLIIQFA